ncbi:hypothetical protein [Blastopirellula marina]|uniref:Uncharacterized protein n=1 Tax=Blastopirellula marina DSM 3645 TaxID=314230 RepID=A3ZR88_9BACT|nr:hypothetical protein [Blastopirellula marina]EAQ81184.1 hypothetical protein DSM3645_21472 [Blastopirellula marina DSM 3645]
MNLDEETPASPPLRRPGQFGILTLMLLSMAIAAWVAAFQLPQQCRQARVELDALRRLTNADEQEPWRRLSAIPFTGRNITGFLWAVYLPPQASYRIAWTTARSPDSGGAFVSMESAPISAGEHEIAIRYFFEDDHWVAQTRIDDQVSFEQQLPADWNLQLGSFDLMKNRGGVEQPANQACVLHDEIYYTPDETRSNRPSTKNSNTGLRVWLEPIEQ